MTVPRLRMIAGPNGSGKSTLFEDLRKQVPLGHWLNPDKLERELMQDDGTDLARWGISIDEVAFHAFVLTHGLYSQLPQSQQNALPKVVGTRLELGQPFVRSHLNSIICDYLRTCWLRDSVSFTFETVMSHAGKIDFFVQARSEGYRTYLYYICTDSPIINQERVVNRVAMGGHAVEPATIVSRYARSLALLPIVVKAAWRAYLFDNSSEKGHRMIAEYHDGTLVGVASEPMPAWAINAGVLK